MGKRETYCFAAELGTDSEERDAWWIRFRQHESCEGVVRRKFEFRAGRVDIIVYLVADLPWKLEENAILLVVCAFEVYISIVNRLLSISQRTLRSRLLENSKTVGTP